MVESLEMGSVDRVVDRTFEADYTGDGAVKLRERVKEKLKEFMGDYTDDTLVEYVIVLLRNGRSKEEAKNELDVFLGEDSNSFVSWLWTHLSSNLDLYVQPQASFMEEVAKPKLTSAVHVGSNDSSHLESPAEIKSNQVSRTRHNREWKGLVRDAAEPPPLLSSVIEIPRKEEKTQDKVSHLKRSLSPELRVRKKRSRPDERHNLKEGEVSKATIHAPRRLLQFAVRDAVATSRPSNSSTEPTLKRLRSVVSTPSGDSSLVDRPRRLKSVARVPNPMASVFKAVTEAVEDAKRVRSSGNVFDRLGHDRNVLESNDQLARFREAAVNDGHYEDFEVQDQRSDFSGKFVNEMTMLESETELAYDSTYDHEGYDEVSVIGRRVTNVSQIGTSHVSKANDSLLVQYNVEKNADDFMHIARTKDQHKPTSASNASSKIVNISVNVNTWKPPYYQAPREFAGMNNQIAVQSRDVGAAKSGAQFIKEKSYALPVGNGNARPAADSQRVSQKTASSAHGLTSDDHPLEDADSRTIFVSNVHFAAAKDSLSQHFNKFGEVLKVVIVTDAATRQPKGSAFVEFMRKEAADNALSLNGTSFMSRILKVVKKSSTHQEPATTMTRPQIARGYPFPVARFSRAPFARGMPSSFRSRLPLKPRSMQWKRDSQVTPTPGETAPSPSAHGFTYVRSEHNQNGNSATT